MPFHLTPLTTDDIPHCVTLYFSSFQNPHSLACWPRNIPTIREWWENMLRSELQETSAYWLKVIDVDREVLVGFCKWVSPQSGIIPSTALPSWPEGADAELCDGTFGAWARGRRDLMGARGHWYLEIIATDPEYQGRGIGKMMMGWGLERADADGEGWEIYLEASEEAVGFYERFGFREVGRLDTWIDNERVKKTWYRNLFMLRPARTQISMQQS